MNSIATSWSRFCGYSFSEALARRRPARSASHRFCLAKLQNYFHSGCELRHSRHLHFKPEKMVAAVRVLFCWVGFLPLEERDT